MKWRVEIEVWRVEIESNGEWRLKQWRVMETESNGDLL